MKDKMVLTFAPETVREIEELAKKRGVTRVDIIRSAIATFLVLDEEVYSKKNQKLAIVNGEKIISKLIIY